MAKAKKDNLKELKAIGEELFEILTPEDPDTGEEMELGEFLKGTNKKLTEKGLFKTLVEACEALEEEDGDDASEELMAFMEEHDIDIPWAGSDEYDPDEDEDLDDDDDEPDDEDDEDVDESPDFSKMNIKELKAFAKENKIKGIAGLKKDELIELIESALEDEDPDDEDEPDDVDDDDIDEDDVDDVDDTDDVDDDEDKYDELSLKEIKALMKKAGHSPKAIKKMDRDEMIEHLEAADDEDDDGDEEEKEMSLEEILNETTKLADLQALVAEHDEFKGIRKKAKKIKGLQGPRELKPLMYKALGVEAPAKKAKVKKEKGPRTVIPGFALKRRQFEASLISTGKYTNETLKKAVLKQYPNFNELSLKTEITDGKNPDYCKFDFPIVEDKKTKKLSFGTFKKDHFEI